MRWILVAAFLMFGLTSCTKEPVKTESIGSINPVIFHHKESRLPVWHSEYQTTYVQPYDSGAPETDELEGVQCPIPMKDRVRNYTGIQCVFSSTEMIGRWAECKELINPPITSRSDCKRYSGPSDLRNKLERFGLKPYTEGGSGPMYRQVYRNKQEAIRVLKEAMSEGRGALFGVPGHAMVVVHYDEAANIVKWVDNSDRSLRVQTMTVNRFMQRWDGWICVIYAEPDLMPAKAKGLSLAQQIPIFDRNEDQRDYPPDYIPMPR